MDSGGPILVTGGAGYVGAHVCKALAAAGHLPVTYDDLSTGRRELVKWGPLELGAIGDRARLAETFLRTRPRAVIHLAGLVTGADGPFDMDSFYRVNVEGGITLLRAMAEAGVKSLVFCSSAAVYGVPETLPVDETEPLDAITPGGTSKAMIERALPDFARAHGIDWLALRVFNAFGADSDGEAGEWHEPETHLVPSTILTALGAREALDVYGTDYGTSDGTTVRDYVHVADVAEAHLKALGHVLAGGQSTAVNIGTGRGRSISEIIESVERVSGRMVTLREAPPRPGDAPVLIANPGRAARLLKWKPRHVDLDAAMRTAYDWHAARLGA